MEQDKMHLINKIFNDETIRTVWDKDKEKYYISVVDVVAALTDIEVALVDGHFDSMGSNPMHFNIITP